MKSHILDFLVTTLGLPKLSTHFSTFVTSFFIFLLVHKVFAPALCQWLFPLWFGTTENRSRNSWTIRVVSQVHAVLIVPLALKCLDLPDLDDDRAFGWDDRAGFVHAISCGYFLWDSFDAITSFTDISFLIHGLACLAIYTLSFKPFLAYYGVRCLLWEMSTFFLNIHWFFDKTGRTGSVLQLANGIILLVTFFGVRLVYGGKTSYDFFHTLYDVREQIPFAYVIVYGIGNIALQALNWLWFAKMVSALQKRLNDRAQVNPRASKGK